ncbi:hypothetical protein [Pedobacter cryoconitis]|uniref:Uncharacterized protein n=1 Tax=Pedobacter cryoconitis TaxID=188932 RepID=A0A327SUU8_9SPHI|nr:hypothetical protein [Pedobacter cryoconitis]RAJ33080.1 hypothetical protein LY11_01770 [Pedobacter cryoconitis]
MTGTDFANRLLNNIQTSLGLRSRIPYLDILKELKQGGMSIAADTLNTSSNFGSFDRALKEVLTLLHQIDNSLMPPPDILPLPLTLIYQNLTDHLDILSEIFQKYKDQKETPLVTILDHLETINLAAV